MRRTVAATTDKENTLMIDRHPSTTHLLGLFESGHLPRHPAEISEHFEALATELVVALDDGPELTAGLRKLLEAKDCCVRQAVIDAKK
ncbi:hypothetical protein WKY82_10470 [Gordonia malaquae]|uniref:hypothetical protein n=1 Tax=Gordonia malaquae TaxID=410332 RepID=UPI0030C78EBA